MKLDLTPITICAADCVNPKLAARALNLSMQECSFGDSILFSDRHEDGPFRNESIERLCSSANYSRFILRDLHRYIKTPFVLIVQWDGYILDPRAWTAEFFDYDYIGAIWPWFQERKVGNGGFSLRSRRLLDATASMPDFAPPHLNEDLVICRYWSGALACRGIRFAPEGVAGRFSYERLLPDGPTFGFHGMFNMWRHLGDDELKAVAASLDQNTLWRVDYIQCMLMCFFQRRFEPSVALYARLRELRSAEQVRDVVANVERDRATIDAFISIVEAALRRTQSHGRDR